MPEATDNLTLFDSDDRPTLAEGRGRIRPRARLLRTIGAELISSEVVAVVELVRNSYDADATRVQLIFDNPEDLERASLQIRDNGHGMSREVLLGPWLEPATDHKQGVGATPTGGDRSPGGRRRLGSKGVGRFAAQRIGSRLEVRTRTAGGSTELSAWFDWAVLDEGTYLDELRIPWRERYPTHLEMHGTHLVISGLRDRWSPDRFDRLRVGLSRLISPTMEDSLSIEITINGAHEVIAPALGLDEAMYSIRGRVDPDGACHIRYGDLTGEEEVWERTVLWPEGSGNCGPFSFEIGAWDLDSAPLRHFLAVTGKKVGLRDFRRTMRDHAGIALYRDGFRVLPYGEPDNDWLRLDRRRVNNPTMRLSNNQVLGRILITADENPELSDQTNREGLVNNEAYAHLQEVVLELLGYLETRRFAARRNLDIDWQRKTSHLPSLEEGESDRLASLLSSLSGEGKTSRAKTEEILDAFKRVRDASAETVRHYAGAATTGQLAGLVLRQLEHPLKQVRSELDLALDELIRGSRSDEDLDGLVGTLRSALQHLGAVEQRLELFDPITSPSGGRRLVALDLSSALMEVVEAYHGEFDRRGAFLDFEPAELTVRTNREVAQQVFANLLDNALYWCDKGENGTPIVRVRLDGRGFTIEDSGPGVPAKVAAAIFEPQFTTRADGHGLGLTLVRDLLATVGGRVKLADPACARFSVLLGDPSA